MDEPAILALLGAGIGGIVWWAAPGRRPKRPKREAIVTITLAALAPMAASFHPAIWLGTAWLWLLLALAVSDLRCRRLPNVLTIALGGTALGWAWASGTFGLDQAAGAGLVAAGAFWGLRLAYAWRRGHEGLGLGDVKLMFGIGAATGIPLLPWVTLIAAVGALAVAVLTPRPGDLSARRIPFGAYLAGAAALVWGLSPLIP